MSLLCIGNPLAYGSTYKESWQAIFNHHATLPSRLVAVDKDKQQLLFYSKGKRFQLENSYVCTTGKRIGDKQVRGDLKTPEGIYFVVRHLDSGLDFFQYGYEAYTLNYPNPVDRLHGKTGYGIWIHGKGETIRPLLTQGCVAMNNDDLEVLGKMLEPGTPVALTGSFAYTAHTMPEDEKIASVLAGQVERWSKAWSGRSKTFFDFYDQAAYSKAQAEPFSRFRLQKERLFSTLPWIATTVHDVQVLKGPGYWVTWFYQLYEAPNHTAKGIRRLYWQRNDKGEFLIVGMEWLPGAVSSTLIAEAEPAVPPLESNPTTEEDSELGVEPDAMTLAEMPAMAALEDPAVPQLPQKKEALARPALALALYQKGELAVASAPREGTLLAAVDGAQPLAGLKVISDEALSIAATSNSGGTPKVSPALTQSGVLPSVPPQVNVAAFHGLPPPLPAQGLAISAPQGNTEEQVTIASVTTQDVPEPAPAAPLVPVGVASSSASEPLEEKTQLVAEVAEKVTEDLVGDLIGKQRSAEVLTQEPAQASLPAETLVAENSSTSVSNQEALLPRSTDASLQEQLTISVVETIEEWRKAWEAGDLEWYMEFYADAAQQGARQGLTAIRQQKSTLWRVAAPRKVVLRDLTIRFEDEAVYVSVVQEYTDSNGKGDIGVKSITLKRSGDMWFIVREDWSPR